MSGKKKPPGGGGGGKGRGAKPPAKNRFRVVRSDANAKPSPEAIRQLYMASHFIEWTPFAASMGWKSLDSRNGLPIDQWIQDKRDVFAREQAETIAEAVFHHRSRWHQDVLKTLKEYPEANDAMLGILKKRLNDIIATINDDQRSQVIAAQTGGQYVSEFKKIKNGDLLALSAAIKVCTESKHKALMINEWSFKVAESFSDPKQFARESERVADTEWKVSVIGGEAITNRQMQEFLGAYYDKPAIPHTPEEVAAAAAGEGAG